MVPTHSEGLNQTPDERLRPAEFSLAPPGGKGETHRVQLAVEAEELPFGRAQLQLAPVQPPAHIAVYSGSARLLNLAERGASLQPGRTVLHNLAKESKSLAQLMESFPRCSGHAAKVSRIHVLALEGGDFCGALDGKVRIKVSGGAAREHQLTRALQQGIGIFQNSFLAAGILKVLKTLMSSCLS